MVASWWEALEAEWWLEEPEWSSVLEAQRWSMPEPEWLKLVAQQLSKLVALR